MLIVSLFQIVTPERLVQEDWHQIGYLALSRYYPRQWSIEDGEKDRKIAIAIETNSITEEAKTISSRRQRSPLQLLNPSILEWRCGGNLPSCENAGVAKQWCSLPHSVIKVVIQIRLLRKGLRVVLIEHKLTIADLWTHEQRCSCLYFQASFYIVQIWRFPIGYRTSNESNNTARANFRYWSPINCLFILQPSSLLSHLLLF